MKAPLLCIITLLLLFVSCKKHYDTPGTTIPPGNNPSANDAPRLKDMIVNRLPSPYYHFDYDDSGKITGVNYQSGLRIYTVSYTDKKISQMENIIEPVRDRLEYVYNNNRVARVNIINRNNINYRRAFMTYNPSGKLANLYWEVLDNGDFTSEQILVFSYHQDGNLWKIENTTFAVGPLTDGTLTETYDDYDDKIAAEGFNLLLPLPQNHLILLPDVKLMLNNPRRVVRTGTGTTDYTIDYQYTYDNKGKPISKAGDFVFTDGSNAGQHTALSTTYTWY